MDFKNQLIVSAGGGPESVDPPVRPLSVGGAKLSSGEEPDGAAGERRFPTSAKGRDDELAVAFKRFPTTNPATNNPPKHAIG
jgi:hypothetical protein